MRLRLIGISFIFHIFSQKPKYLTNWNFDPAKEVNDKMMISDETLHLKLQIWNLTAVEEKLEDLQSHENSSSGDNEISSIVVEDISGTKDVDQ